jgi:hypothetical protein
MINLLPPDLKTGYLYARRNLSLRKWVILVLIALIGLGGLGAFGLMSLKQSQDEYSKQVAASQALLQKENYAETQKRVKEIGDSFKLVVKVLGQEVLFSQLLRQIAAAIPTGANLTGLTISQTQGGIDISANAVDYNTATQVQVNLADPENKIFSKADIISINCNTDPTKTGQDAIYPCTVNVRALFSNNNPYLFINSKGARR